MLAESKLNGIEKLISKALSDMETCHEEFIIILDKKYNYKSMKFKLKNNLFLCMYIKRKHIV